MTVSTSDILGVLAAHGIDPYDAEISDTDLPGIGEIDEGETVYSTSISEVFGLGDEREGGPDILDTDDPRLRGWWADIEGMIESRQSGFPTSIPIDEPRDEPFGTASGDLSKLHSRCSHLDTVKA